MNVLFINFTKNIFYNVGYPFHDIAPLDIGYCASILEKEGHVANFIDCITLKNKENLIKTLKKINFDILIIKPQLFNNFFESLLGLCYELEEDNKNIFLIGPAANLYSEQLLFYNSPIDAILINEPEYILLELIRNYSGQSSFKNVKGIKFYSDNKLLNTGERDSILNLDKLPFPKHSFFITKGYNFYYPVDINAVLNIGYMLSSRGCPYKCIFCSELERVSFGKRYIVRSAKNLAGEMIYLKSKNINAIYFEDDIFSINDLQTKRFCREILKQKISLKWIIQSRVDVFSKASLRLMKKCGCSTICYGIESTSNQTLEFLNKGTNFFRIREAIRETKRNKIYVVGFLIIGCPKEGAQKFNKTLKIIKHLNLDFIQIHFFTPYKGSYAYLFSKYQNNIQTKSDICAINPRGVILKNMQNRLYSRFYLNLSFITTYFYNHFWFVIFNIRHQYILFKKSSLYLSNKENYKSIRY